MLKNKKADGTFTLEKLIELIIGLMIFIVLFEFLTSLYGMISSEEISQAELDIKRIISEIEDMTQDIKIPLITENLQINLFDPKDTKPNGCLKNLPCICYKTSNLEKNICFPIENPPEMITSFKTLPLEGLELDDQNLVFLKKQGTDIILQKDD